MAGIGFALTAQLTKRTLAGDARALGAAGLIGAGPSAISIGAMLALGVLTQRLGRDAETASRFFALVTQLIAASLVLAGALQLLVTRFVADRVYEGRDAEVGPNVLGAVALALVASVVLGGAFALFGLDGVPVLARVLAVASLALLSASGVLSVVLTGLKSYRAVLVVFAVGEAITVLACLALSRYGLAGYVAGFFGGSACLALGLLGVVTRAHPGPRTLAFAFLDRRRAHLDLAIVGLGLGLAAWADKIVFWYSPLTSEALVGAVRHSPVYDVPVSLAYATAAPGVAILVLRVETSFASAFDAYFAAIREGGTLATIRDRQKDLARAAQGTLLDVACAQGIAAVTSAAMAAPMLAAFGIPRFYAPLFAMHLAGTAFQVLFVAAVTLLFYLDHRAVAAGAIALFAVTNVALSYATLGLGPRFFGLGFAASGALAGGVAIFGLSRKLVRLDFDTFMGSRPRPQVPEDSP